MNENKLVLDPRLSAAASFVRDFSVVCDIGTDHAFLPISLILEGRAKFAIASDVNNGPLDRARESAERYGVTDKMRFVLADGLRGIDPARYGVNEIMICGMGGELIERIISADEYPKKNGVRLILQPMTHAEKLRKYLAREGFAVLDEKMCRSAGRIYTVISAEYDGILRNFSEAEFLLGDKNIMRRDDLFEEFTLKHAKKLRVQIDGIERGGGNSECERALLGELEKILG